MELACVCLGFLLGAPIKVYRCTIRLMIDLHNNKPGPSGRTPTEIFNGIQNHTNRLLDFQSFGCPIFVLDPTLQQGHKLPHWKPCSRVGVYLGHSPLHASSIPLVLSTTTGLVSPQFHVVYNDHFTTTTCLAMNTLPENWKHLLATSSTNYVDDDFDPQKFSTSSWLDDITTTPPFISSSLNTDSTLSQREIHVPSDSSSASQRESPTTHPGWNANHKYETRFHKKFIPATLLHLIKIILLLLLILIYLKLSLQSKTLIQCILRLINPS